MVDFVMYRCAYHGGSFGRGQTKALQCSQPRTGRYVFVKLRVNEYLTLCEVEVMGVSGMYLPWYILVSHVDSCFSSIMSLIASLLVFLRQGRYVLAKHCLCS